VPESKRHLTLSQNDSNSPTTLQADGLIRPTFYAELESVSRPPAGWRVDRAKAASDHFHQTWVSPTGKTAFGIVYFKLPFPVGHDLAFRYGFLREMKKDQGEVKVLERSWDGQIDGIRFIVEGGLYKLRSAFYVRGTQGWTVYAGTLRGQPEDAQELNLAESAREQTLIDYSPPTTRPVGQ